MLSVKFLTRTRSHLFTIFYSEPQKMMGEKKGGEGGSGGKEERGMIKSSILFFRWGGTSQRKWGIRLGPSRRSPESFEGREKKEMTDFFFVCFTEKEKRGLELRGVWGKR